MVGSGPHFSGAADAIVYGGGGAMGGFSLACASIECFTRSLAGEVGKHGVRVVSLRPNFTPETSPEPVNLESER